MLVEKTLFAAKSHDILRIAVTGGVATNSRLRARMAEETEKLGCKVYFPYPELCTDNAAMVALAGYHQVKAGILIKEDADVYSRLPFLGI
ncbi:MAG: hypothetical protein AVO38_16030 [delta proteobacterium ML8_D]|nr:MAG: hypothetical protein AVO38_16030 [delta proteobacterium ML8_D]